MSREDIIRLAREVSQNFAHRNYEDDLVEFFNMAYAAGAAAEREGLKQERRRDMDEINSLREAEESLREEVERLREDAERYRWLRSQTTHDGCVVVMKNKDIDDEIGYAENIDRFIDKAMQEAALRREERT